MKNYNYIMAQVIFVILSFCISVANLSTMPINDLPDISQEITTASLTEPSIYFRYNPEHISKTHPKLLPMGKVKHRHNHSSYPKHSIKPIPVPTREKHQLRLSGKPYGKSSHFNIEEKMHRPGLPPDYRTKEYSESNFSEQQPLSTPYTFRTTIIVEEEHRGSHKRRLRGYFIKTPTRCSPGFVRVSKTCVSSKVLNKKYLKVFGANKFRTNASIIGKFMNMRASN